MTAIAVGIAAGGIAAKVAHGAHWAYVGIGAGFTALGVLVLAYGLRRHLEVERALDEGRFSAADPRLLAALSACGAVLGVLTIVLLITSL
jgi:uncharacterized membrane protein YidH (DUF202 family)